MHLLRPLPDRAFFPINPLLYGRSVYGAPLFYFPAQQETKNSGLILAGTHGDETASVTTLSCALRSIDSTQLKHHIILSVNPDGNQLGVRSNANYVDLNRNFPSTNFSKEQTVYRWNSQSDKREVRIHSSSSSSPEPEVTALCQLIEKLKPAFTVSFHEPLSCIDDPILSPLGHCLSHLFDLPLITDIGYDTPGSFGSWCREQKLPCVTVELPAISPDKASENYLNAAVELLTTSTSTLTYYPGD